MSLLGCDLAGALVPLAMALALLIAAGVFAHLRRPAGRVLNGFG